MSAARPRPSRDLPASSAIIDSPEVVLAPHAWRPAWVFENGDYGLQGLLRRASRRPAARIRRTGAQLLLALDDLGRQPQISFAADAFQIIDQNRLAVRWGFRHPDIARNDGVVDFAPHELADIGDHLIGKIVACIVHRQNDAMD